MSFGQYITDIHVMALPWIKRAAVSCPWARRADASPDRAHPHLRVGSWANIHA